jgi:hypothetical protein
LAEVGAPDIVVAVFDYAVVVSIGGECGAELAQLFSPDNIIGRVDDSVAVVVACDVHDERAVDIKLRRVLHRAGAERGQVNRIECAA